MKAKYPQEIINLAYKEGTKYIDKKMSQQQISTL